jgi:hypothetical protein
MLPRARRTPPPRRGAWSPACRSPGSGRCRSRAGRELDRHEADRIDCIALRRRGRGGKLRPPAVELATGGRARAVRAPPPQMRLQVLGAELRIGRHARQPLHLVGVLTHEASQATGFRRSVHGVAAVASLDRVAVGAVRSASSHWPTRRHRTSRRCWARARVFASSVACSHCRRRSRVRLSPLAQRMLARTAREANASRWS